jgi:hypothetical protein
VFSATIDRRGHIRVEGRGQFKTLSGAARKLSGTHVDGWRAWIVERTGQYIDSLRQELLESRAADSDTATDESVDSSGANDSTARERHAFLREARELAQKDPLRIRVIDLLATWGADSRDSGLNDQIEAELSNYGLGTDPSFTAVSLNERISLKLLDEISDQADESPAPQEVAETEPVPTLHTPPEKANSSGARKRLGVTVGTLRSASAGVEYVKPGAGFEEAITKMLINDYSQLAVMSSPHSLKGAVNWRSIARARHSKPDAGLEAAIFTPKEYPYTTDLIDALPTLDEEDFFFVRGPSGAVNGIVTAADVVSAYRDMASPFLMIGEIDQMLRNIVEVAFDSETISEGCDPGGTRAITSVTQLTMGDYKQILDHPARWGDLEWPLDRRVFCDRLDTVREIRNKVMHFNSDPISEITLQRLRHFIDLLREYGTA